MGLDFLFVYPLDVISTLQDIRADIIGSKLAVMSSVASLLASSDHHVCCLSVQYLCGRSYFRYVQHLHEQYYQVYGGPGGAVRVVDGSSC